MSGLVDGHAYTVLAAREVKRGGGGGGGEVLRLLQLRNPWGTVEWHGDWSKGSPLWTDDVRSSVGDEGDAASDGKFWIDLNNLMRYFFSVNVCHCNERWVEKRRRVCFTDKISGPM